MRRLEHVRIQVLSGGLGNQIRQYVFVRYVERRVPQQRWIFDDTYFFKDKVDHNGYELEKLFGIHANLMSRRCDNTTWNELVRLKKQGAFLPQVLLDAGMPIVMVEGSPGHGFFRGLTVKHYQNLIDVLNLPYTNLYCFDYWIEDDWFERDREENLAELTFPVLEDTKNLHYADLINSSMSIGIHIRRCGTFKDEWAVPMSDYQSACRKVLDDIPDAWFFVFSDDLDWCKTHAAELGLDLAAHTVYVEGNVDGKNYIDMQLMSMCRGIIRLAQSSFSQVAAWLDRDLLFEIKLGKIFC